MEILIAILVALSGLQQQAPIGTATIEGVVTRAGTSQPIGNARVAVISDRGKHFEASTDGNGHFVLSNLPADIFNFQVQAEGYVDDPAPRIVVRLGLRDGERLRHDVALTPISSINVRIVDDSRKPIAGIKLDLLRKSIDFTGRASWQNVSSGVTDEEGAYRFERLLAGDFYIRASRKSVPAAANQDSGEMPATYFPGTLAPRAAAVISLRAGDIKRA